MSRQFICQGVTMNLAQRNHAGTNQASLKTVSKARRNLLATSAVIGALGLVLLATTSCSQTAMSTDAQAAAGRPPESLRTKADDTTIRPFHINIPDEAFVDLRRRIVATQWPEMETVP